MANLMASSRLFPSTVTAELEGAGSGCAEGGGGPVEPSGSSVRSSSVFIPFVEQMAMRVVSTRDKKRDKGARWRRLVLSQRDEYVGIAEANAISSRVN